MSAVVPPQELMLCPICIDTMQTPILQCKKGHSMCGSCIEKTSITMCPLCRGELTTVRNYQLEQLVAGVNNLLKTSCRYIANGCKFSLTEKDKQSHEAECKYRRFHCEGRLFANWPCEWQGAYVDVYNHFKECHRDNARMEYKAEASLKINFQTDFKDIQIISFFNGQNYFYYKHKLDVSKKRCYWHFQMIGLKSQAQNFYYEFEVHNGVRKFKVTEICTNDATDINETFKKEKCVVMTFNTVKNYINEYGEISFKFRIMANKKTIDAK